MASDFSQPSKSAKIVSKMPENGRFYPILGRFYPFFHQRRWPFLFFKSGQKVAKWPENGQFFTNFRAQHSPFFKNSSTKVVKWPKKWPNGQIHFSKVASKLHLFLQKE
jgi:hypothetical protein